MLHVLLTLMLLVLATPAWATTFYVGKSGNNANPCETAQSSTAGDRKLTITGAEGGMSCMNAGDTLIIGNGTYTEALGHGVTNGNFVSGVSDTVRTIYRAENNRQVILNGCLNRVMDFSNRRYIEIDGIVLDGLNTCNTVLHFKDQTADGLETAYIRFKNGTVKNAEGTVGGTGLIYGGNTTGFDNVHHIEIINNTITTMDQAHINPGNHCMYFKVPDSLIERNDISDCYGSGITTHNTQGNPGNNMIIRYNEIHDIDSGACIRLSTGSNMLAHNNLCYDIRDSALGGTANTPLFVYNYGGATNAQFYNNIVYGSTNAGNSCLRVGAGAANAKVRNNICYGGSNDTILDGGTASTISHNRCASGCTTSANPLLANAAGNDFTLTASSTMINAGTNVGFAYNGAAPDIGAFETFTHSVCTVDDGAATTLKITFENNVNPPIRPLTGIAFGTNAITSRKAGANNVVTAAVKNGDNRVDLTLTDAIVNGNAVDYSYSTTSGNLTDSALIGGTKNQPFFALTNQPCTNNVGAAPTHVWSQAAYEFHGKYGTEAAPIIKPDGVASTGAAENFTNMTVIPGGSVRVRFAVTCTTADCPAVGLIPRYSKNGGAYTVVPDAFTADNIGFCGTSAGADVPNNGTATTNQLSTSGTFVAGAVVLTSNAIPTVDIALNGKTELEYCLSFDTDATSGDYYDLRLYNQDGTAINTYTVTPRITITTAAGGFGELWELLLFTMLPVLGRIESQTAKPSSNLAVSHPHLDQVLIEGMACTSLKTSGTGLKRTVTCLH